MNILTLFLDTKYMWDKFIKTRHSWQIIENIRSDIYLYFINDDDTDVCSENNTYSKLLKNLFP